MSRHKNYKIVVVNDNKVMNIHDPLEEQLEQEWFKTHKKDMYSMSDFMDYAYSQYLGLKESIEELEKGAPESDIIATIKQKIRRTIKKNFSVKRNSSKDAYKLDKLDMIYLINDLLKDYFNKFVFIHKERFSTEEKIKLLNTFVSFAERTDHKNDESIVKLKSFLNNLEEEN